MSAADRLDQVTLHAPTLRWCASRLCELRDRIPDLPADACVVTENYNATDALMDSFEDEAERLEAQAPQAGDDGELMTFLRANRERIKSWRLELRGSSGERAQAPQAKLEWRELGDSREEATFQCGPTHGRAIVGALGSWNVATSASGYEPTLESAKAHCEAVAAAMFGELRETNDEDLVCAKALWSLLDDIDTLDDSCRARDDVFRARVREIQKKRHDILKSDGYTLSRVEASRD